MMAQFLKDDLTVALDDVDRILFRSVTLHEQLGHLAAEPDLGERLLARSRRLDEALNRYNRIRESAGQIPELEDPERAQLEALWFKLKSLVAQAGAEASLDESISRLDDTVLHAVDAALALHPEPGLQDALRAIEAEVVDSAPHRSR